MNEHPISKILSKIILPEPPMFTSEFIKDLEILTTYDDNLSKYESMLNTLKAQVFTPALANSKQFTEMIAKLKDIKAAVEKDKARLNTGFGVKFIIDLLGCKKMPVRIPKETFKNNPNLINENSRIYIEDTYNVCILRFDHQEPQFSIPECPCCEQDGISNKQELLNHLKKSHITYKSMKKKWDQRSFSFQNVDFDKMEVNPTPETIGNLTISVVQLYLHNTPTKEFQRLRNTAIEYLQKLIQKHFPESELLKYGSSDNGFCLHSSDIDLCLVLNEKSAFKHPKYYSLLIQEIGENATNSLSEIIVLSKIYSTLLAEKVNNLEMIEGARVKIVSFKTPTDPPFAVDVSVNKKVVLENTRLIRTYSLIDERVAKIGVIIKLWAKEQNIADPKSGTLSSYAYILLVIYFFQRISNPILPSLQEGVVVKNYVDSYDCSFHDDFQVFSQQAMLNTDSEGLLLLQFFKFYSFFDWNSNTVDIRKAQYSKKMNKDSQFFISIQDPFEPLRNLGDVITNQEACKLIINCFKQTYIDLSRGINLNNIVG